MTELDRHDLQWCLRRAPKQVLELMKKHGPKIVVAGGYIRSCIANEKINDIDLFCQTKESAAQFAKELANGGKVHETDNAFTVSTKRRISVQFIHRWTFDTPAACIDSFDFTIACGCFWFDGSWQSLTDDHFYPDLSAKRLVYRAPKRNEDAGGSMLRVLKFYQRGYRIPLDSLGAVIARLNSGVDTNKIRNESDYARIVTALLVEVDPAIDPTHIAHLPSLENVVS